VGETLTRREDSEREDVVQRRQLPLAPALTDELTEALDLEEGDLIAAVEEATREVANVCQELNPALFDMTHAESLAEELGLVARESAL